MSKAKTKSNIIPLGDRVLVKSLDREGSITDSGIIIPDTVDKERPEMGRVIATGEGKVNDAGKVVPMKVKIGDKILFSKYGPDEVKIDGEDFLFVSENNILAIIK